MCMTEYVDAFGDLFKKKKKKSLRTQYCDGWAVLCWWKCEVVEPPSVLRNFPRFAPRLLDFVVMAPGVWFLRLIHSGWGSISVVEALQFIIIHLTAAVPRHERFSKRLESTKKRQAEFCGQAWCVVVIMVDISLAQQTCLTWLDLFFIFHFLDKKKAVCNLAFFFQLNKANAQFPKLVRVSSTFVKF